VSGTQVRSRGTSERVRPLGEPPPTERQLEALRAYVRLGSHLDAAAALGISQRTFKSHLAALRQRLGVQTTAQAVYVLWLGYRDHLEDCDRSEHGDCLPPLSDVALSR
jgi:DNA-binding CsgD family transcriptional regulator